MTRSDVAAVHQKDQEDWKKRGVTGTVTAIDPADLEEVLGTVRGQRQQPGAEATGDDDRLDDPAVPRARHGWHPLIPSFRTVRP